MSVEFIGPPPAGKNTKHDRNAQDLKARPGEWGVVQRTETNSRAASAAQAIRTAKLAAYAPAGSFEAVARTVTEAGVAEHRVYARYVGRPQ
ncbi:hypothetical protein RKE29_02705 [Streptomyces sp. B1866]|uniref:hypothetical protein n=1 Tax=Streptomyces sp. B1866 TaxID=3075431 RepID=UPI00288DF76C|nr:hypothetical protein [Streptomyces sp. B1866]MDT3395569.1 hypothetical protein [Streptomyces sp. B1866]